ncbi:MAG TPA: hypothetical protein QGF63_14785 [Alphaproteobacteria bacterium]|nr:hypothetical protein [Alphaproteobacteria bacterium]
MVKTGTAKASKLTNSEIMPTSRYIGFNGLRIGFSQAFGFSSDIPRPTLGSRRVKITPGQIVTTLTKRQTNGLNQLHPG